MPRKKRLFERLVMHNIFCLADLSVQTGLTEPSLMKIFYRKELNVNYHTVKAICEFLGYDNPFDFEKDLERFDVQNYKEARKRLKWKEYYTKKTRK